MSVDLFVDEAKSRGYAMVVVAVPSGDVAHQLAEVALLRRPGQARVHFVKEGDSRRREILSRLCAARFRARVYVAPPRIPQRDGRAACLRPIVSDAAGSTRPAVMTLERDETIERLDRQKLYRFVEADGARDRVVYRHEAASHEPLLWVTDAIAWAFVRRGEWVRRVEPLIESVVRIDSDAAATSAKLGMPTVRKATELTSRR